MKIVLLLLTVLACFSVCSMNGQTLTDSLYHKMPSDYRYAQHGKRIPMQKLTAIMKTSPVAYEEYKKAQSSRFFSAIVGGAGGFMIGWSIGDLIGGRKFNWTLAGIGAGLIIVNIPIHSTDVRHTRNAVHLYNSGLK
ncbi:MAG: hypothetical protein WBP41_03020 [Saprospiraceae bacterium]